MKNACILHLNMQHFIFCNREILGLTQFSECLRFTWFIDYEAMIQLIFFIMNHL